MKRNNQRLIIIINRFILFGLLLFIISSCSKSFYQSKWQATPVIIDGNLSDWDVPLQYYDTDTKLNYTISDDEKNFYISIRVGDDQTQSKMLAGGFNLWIDTKGGKNKTLGITYPLPRKMLMNHNQNENQSGQKPDMYARRKKLMEDQTQMMLTGFSNTLNGMSLIHNKDGIQVGISYDSSGTLDYEAIIPFKTFYKESIISKDTIKLWSIGMVVNGIEMQPGGGGEHKNNSGGTGSSGMHGGGGGGGGMHGGGMHGGGHGGGGRTSGNQETRNLFSETVEAWNKIRLSFKPEVKGN